MSTRAPAADAPVPVHPGEAASSAIGYVAGIDGLRALAVIAVILYHSQQNMLDSWMPGGFLGVEMFFVISGYLITTLLIAEHRRDGRISIGRFWVRRARRLLPALFALLVVAMGIVGFGGDSLREHVRAFRGMWVSAWLYFTNWFQIIAGLNYADASGRPPLLRHLWSLAVEEQFYLVWPLVMWWLLRRYSRHLRVIGSVFALVAAVITLVVALTYQTGNLWRVNLLYLSTPTRASGLLLGAALAVYWPPWANRVTNPTSRARLVDTGALVGLGVLVWAAVSWHFTTEGIYGPLGYGILFRGGFLLVGVATCLVIVAAAHPGSLIGRHLLGLPPLVWVGKRSYGLYLWHWPIFQLTRPFGDQSLLDSSNPDVHWAWFPTLILRLLLTLVVTEISYRLVEMPVRRGTGFARSRVLAATAAVSLAVCAIPVRSSFAAVDLLAVQAACNRDPDRCPLVAEGEAVPDPGPGDQGAPDTAVSTGSSSTIAAPASTVSDTTTAPTSATSTAERSPAPRLTVPAMPVKPLAIGDSVMLGAKKKLEAAGIRVDAREGRRFGKAVGIVDAYRRAGQVGEVVILALGSNDNLSTRLINEVLGHVADVAHVIVVTPQVNGRNHEARNHRLLLEAAPRFPNVVVVDWRELAQSKLRYAWRSPGVKKASQAYFWADRIHLAPAGQRYYTELIVRAVTAAVR